METIPRRDSTDSGDNRSNIPNLRSVYPEDFWIIVVSWLDTAASIRTVFKGVIVSRVGEHSKVQTTLIRHDGIERLEIVADIFKLN